jgi:hypothetical protein
MYIEARRAVIDVIRANMVEFPCPIYPTGALPSAPDQEYLRWDMIFQQSKLSILEKEGVVLIDIFTPNGNGNKRFAEIASFLDSIFLNRSTNGMHFKASSLGDYRKDGALLIAEYSLTFTFRRT